MANLEKKIQELEKALGEITPIFKEFSKGVKSNGSKGIIIDTSPEAMDDLYSKLEDMTFKVITDASGTTTTGAPASLSLDTQGVNEQFGNIYRKSIELSSSLSSLSYQSERTADAMSAITQAISRVSSEISNFSNNLANNASNTGGGSGGSSSVNPYDSRLDAIIEELINFHLDFNTQYTPSAMNREDAETVKELVKLRALQERDDRKYKEEIRKDRNAKDRDNEFIATYEEKRKNEEKYNKEFARRRENDWSLREIGKGAISLTQDLSKNFISNESVTASKTADTLISGVSKMLPGMYGQITGAVLGIVKGLIEMGTKRDRAASEYARTVGGGEEGRRDFLLAVNELYASTEYHYGDLAYKFDEIYSAMTETADALGRATDQLSTQDMQSLIKLKRFGIDANAFNQFDTLGKSARETELFFAKVYGDAGARGLSFKSVSKAIVDNLKMAQKYTFADGLKGLAGMAEKSVMLKYNMQQVATFAEKVSTLQGAMEASAKLSVLGGDFAINGNPLELLYESLNDVGALNDRLINTFGDQAFFNNRTGQIDMAPISRELMKAASEAVGVSYDEMLNLTYSNARVRMVGDQIRDNAKIEIPDEVRDYIANIATFDRNGNALVTLNGIQKGISDLRDTDFEMLKMESERKSNADNADLGTIYKETSNVAEKLDNMLQWMQEKLGVWMMKIVAKVTGDKTTRGELMLRDLPEGQTRDMALAFYEKYRGTGNYGNDVELARRIRSAVVNTGDVMYQEIKQNYEGRHHATGYAPSLDKNVPGYSQFSGTQMDDQLFGEFREIIDNSNPKRGVPAEMDGSKIVVHDGEVIVPEWAVAGKEDMWRDMVRNGYNPASETHQTKMQTDALAKYQETMSRGLEARTDAMFQQVSGSLQGMSASLHSVEASNNLERVHKPMAVAPVSTSGYNGPLIPSRLGIDFGSVPTMTVRIEGGGNLDRLSIENIALAAARKVLDESWSLISKNQQYYSSRGGYNKEDAPFQAGVVGMNT